MNKRKLMRDVKVILQEPCMFVNCSFVFWSEGKVGEQNLWEDTWKLKDAENEGTFTESASKNCSDGRKAWWHQSSVEECSRI